ncbi:MAG TPA: hypothetical protein VEU11_09230 [Terriglobales bacterium]|nr:hypothetical protein [Terriglobales bacterium]
MRLAVALSLVPYGSRWQKLLPIMMAVAAFMLPIDALGGPTVTAVVNNYTFIQSGFSNSGVAPSSIIAIFGSGMANAPTGPVTLESSAGPTGIPTSLNGASISVTVGGKTVTPAMYYAIPTVIAAVLPASTPTGTGTLTVTYNGTASNAFSIQVVPSALGLDTYYGNGSGLVTMTDAKSGSLINYTNSASPGQIVTLWGTGLGADPADSDTVFTTTPHAVNQSSVQVYFGGVPGRVTYAGSSGYPGLDQINVIVPDPVGCNVAVTAVVGNVASNFPTAPIAQGGGVCSDPLFGITGSDLSMLSGQTNVNSAAVFVSQTSSTDSSGTQMMVSAALADFRHYPGAYGASSGSISIGSCIVTETPSAPTSTGLDVGTVSLMGPAGNYTLMAVPVVTGLYEASLPVGATTPGGTFVFNWTGGAIVGASSVTITLPTPFLTWTNESASTTVTRSQGIHVTWTGGSPASFVIISGTSSPPGGLAASFVCYAPQSALEFTVPSYVTELLPAGSGTLGLVNTTPYKRFTAPGLNSGAAWGSNGNGLGSVTYQ